MGTNTKRVIIDVREPYEYNTGHVNDAINIPPSKLMSDPGVFENIPKDSEIILYCQSGSRSAIFANMIKDMGYTNVVNGINKDQVKSKYGL